MKLKIICKEKEEIIYNIEAEVAEQSLQEIDLKEYAPAIDWLAPIEITSTSTYKFMIYNVFIKDSDIPVHLSPEGVFFFYSPSGEELVLDINLDWANLPPGSYHQELLKELDYRAIEVTLA